jgi:hypothetical protein
MTDNEKGLASFPATGVTVQHIATGLSYDDLVGGFERELGRRDLAAADPIAEVKGFMESSGRSVAWLAREA